MKKLCFLILFCSIGAWAIPVLSPPVVQCAAVSGVTGAPNNLVIPYATWSAANFACEQQDKIYSNFSPGAVPTSTTLTLQQQPIGPNDFHTVTLTGNFLTAFNFSYDIAIDLTLSPAEAITRVSGDLSNPSLVGTPSNLKSVFTEGGAFLGSVTSVANNPGTALPVFATALHVLDSYSPNGGAAVAVSNTFEEQVVPEPGAFALIGGGLLGLGVWKRRKVVH